MSMAQQFGMCPALPRTLHSFRCSPQKLRRFARAPSTPMAMSQRELRRPNGPKFTIVAMTDDHVGAGLTDSLSHPSRTVTGLSRLESELDTKRLGLLHELVPAANLI